MKDLRVAIIVLNWQRPAGVQSLVRMLSIQKYKNFDVYISNSNPDQKVHDILASSFANRPWVKVLKETNDHSCFRRFELAERLSDNYDVFFFIDDDVAIPPSFILDSLNQYEPETYFSWYTWKFLDGGSSYYSKRIRTEGKNGDKIHYGGPGIAMVDSKLFKHSEFFEVINEHAYEIDDLWISYVCDHVLKWPIKHLSAPRVILRGGDVSALYVDIKQRDYNKSSFLKELVDSGWKL